MFSLTICARYKCQDLLCICSFAWHRHPIQAPFWTYIVVCCKGWTCDLQFLPQDKVVEFAKLTPTELLRETQKAIGDSRLADLHRELIEENKACNSSSRVSCFCLSTAISEQHTQLQDSW